MVRNASVATSKLPTEWCEWVRFHIWKDGVCAQAVKWIHKIYLFFFTEIHSWNFFHKVNTFISACIVIVYHLFIHYFKVIFTFISYYWCENTIHQELCLDLYAYIIWTHIRTALPNMPWESRSVCLCMSLIGKMTQDFYAGCPSVCCDYLFLLLVDE